jgi:hypothetical protein
VANLVVKGELVEIRDGLKYLVDQFNGAVGFENDSEGIWGQRNAEDAMGDFASNWKIHREKMTKRMDTLHEKVEKAVDQWKDADQNLADAFNK